MELCYHIVDLRIDGRNEKILTSRGKMKHCDVCTVGSWIFEFNFIAEGKRQASWCKQQYPEAPIILVGNASSKGSLPMFKNVELSGRKGFNVKTGHKLVRDIDAVTYIKISTISGRGYKTLIDKIV